MTQTKIKLISGLEENIKQYIADMKDEIEDFNDIGIFWKQGE